MHLMKCVMIFAFIGLAECYDCTNNNPCLSSDTGFFFHQDPTMFTQCGLGNQCFVMSCPPGLVWDQHLFTCIRGTTLSTYDCSSRNPCSSVKPDGDFPHDDDDRYVTCSSGTCTINTCTGNTNWDEIMGTCPAVQALPDEGNLDMPEEPFFLTNPNGYIDISFLRVPGTVTYFFLEAVPPNVGIFLVCDNVCDIVPCYMNPSLDCEL